MKKVRKYAPQLVFTAIVAMAFLFVGLPALLASQDRRVLAEELVELTMPEAMFTEIQEASVRMEYEALGMPRRDVNTAVRVTMEVMDEIIPYARVKARTVSHYTTVYTEDELREIVSFLRTPTGRKMIREDNDFSIDLMSWITREIATNEHLLYRRFEAAGLIP
jgi:hypothetical protein